MRELLKEVLSPYFDNSTDVTSVLVKLDSIEFESNGRKLSISLSSKGLLIWSCEEKFSFFEYVYSDKLEEKYKAEVDLYRRASLLT